MANYRTAQNIMDSTIFTLSETNCKILEHVKLSINMLILEDFIDDDQLIEITMAWNQVKKIIDEKLKYQHSERLDKVNKYGAIDLNIRNSIKMYLMNLLGKMTKILYITEYILSDYMNTMNENTVEIFVDTLIFTARRLEIQLEDVELKIREKLTAVTNKNFKFIGLMNSIHEMIMLAMQDVL